MRISVYTIVILASVVLAIVFACLIAVWAGFGNFYAVSVPASPRVKRGIFKSTLLRRVSLRR